MENGKPGTDWKKNPKMVAGITALVILLGGLIFMTTKVVPMIGEVQQEMASTPTPLPPVPDTVRADPYPDLMEGDWGLDVEEMQRRLMELGYFRDSVDGQFGPKTKEALINFQRENSLPANGVLDRKTREALYAQDAATKQK